MDTYNNVYDLEIYHFFDVFQVIPFKLKSFNSHDWPKQNFFLQFLYNIKQTSDENEEDYNSGDYHLIWYENKFSKLTPKELYGIQLGEVLMRS